MSKEQFFSESSFYDSDKINSKDHIKNFRNSVILEEFSQRDLTEAFNDNNKTKVELDEIKKHNDKDTTKTQQITASPSLSALANLLDEKSLLADQKMRDDMVLNNTIIEVDESISDIITIHDNDSNKKKEILNNNSIKITQPSKSPNLIDIDGKNNIQFSIASSNSTTNEQPDFLTSPKVEEPKPALIQTIHSPSKISSKTFLTNQNSINNNGQNNSLESDLYLTPVSRSNTPEIRTKLQNNNNNKINNKSHSTSNSTTPLKTPEKERHVHSSNNNSAQRISTNNSSVDTTPTSAKKKKGLFSFLKKKPSQNLPASSTFNISTTSSNSNTLTPEKLQKKSHSTSSIFSSLKKNKSNVSRGHSNHQTPTKEKNLPTSSSSSNEINLKSKPSKASILRKQNIKHNHRTTSDSTSSSSLYSSSPIKRDDVSKQTITTLESNMKLEIPRNQEKKTEKNDIVLRKTSSDVEVNEIPITYHPNIPELIFEHGTSNLTPEKLSETNEANKEVKSKGLFQPPLENEQSILRRRIPELDDMKAPNSYLQKMDYGESLFPKTLDEQEVESIISLERTRSIKSKRNSTSSHRISSDNYSYRSQNEGMFLTEPTAVILSTPDLSKSPASSILKSGRFENGDAASDFSGILDTNTSFNDSGVNDTSEINANQILPSNEKALSSLNEMVDGLQLYSAPDEKEEVSHSINNASDPFEPDMELMSDIMEFANLIDFGDNADLVDALEADMNTNMQSHLEIEEESSARDISQCPSDDIFTLNEGNSPGRNPTVETNDQSDIKYNDIKTSSHSNRDLPSTNKVQQSKYIHEFSENNVNDYIPEDIEKSSLDNSEIQDNIPSVLNLVAPQNTENVEVEAINPQLSQSGANNESAYFPKIPKHRPISMSFKSSSSISSETKFNSKPIIEQNLKPRVNVPEIPNAPPRPKNKLKFSSQVILFETYSQFDYDRRPEIATCNVLTPQLAQMIKAELNELKSQMEINEHSKCYTHFY